MSMVIGQLLSKKIAPVINENAYSLTPMPNVGVITL